MSAPIASPPTATRPTRSARTASRCWPAAHGIPFYVAAPSSTFDLALSDGSVIPIEQRDPREITHGLGRQTAPEGVTVYNPAFDVTPADLIAGIITERGLIRPVNAQTIREVVGTES